MYIFILFLQISPSATGVSSDVRTPYASPVLSTVTVIRIAPTDPMKSTARQSLVRTISSCVLKEVRPEDINVYRRALSATERMIARIRPTKKQHVVSISVFMCSRTMPRVFPSKQCKPYGVLKLFFIIVQVEILVALSISLIVNHLKLV